MREVLPHIYLLRFGQQRDLCMHFLRFQEYYESPKFFRKFFTIADYKEWYSEKYGEGSFTYPKDWTGFNVPSRCLLPFLENPTQALPDFNSRDRFMLEIIRKVAAQEKGHPFYFIGIFGDKEGSCKDGSVGVIYHELAHALYTTKKKYRETMQRHLDKMDPRIKRQCQRVLAGMGHHQSVIEDEIHAYGATGPCVELEEIFTLAYRRPFERSFERILTRTLQKCAK